MTFETPKGTAAAILGFKTPSSTNSKISPPWKVRRAPQLLLKRITHPGGYFPYKWRIFFDKEIKFYSP